MPTTIKTPPELVRPAGSHSLTLGHGRDYGPFDREELFPVLEVDAPRVGRVSCQFEVNRYVHSAGWSEWRIFLRDVRRPDPERPGYGELVSGVGPSTREAIAAACRPLIEQWLESDEYDESRRRAAARAIVQKIDAPRDYTIRQAREVVSTVVEAGELDTDRDVAIREALELLERAGVLLEEATAG